jgi:protein-S-isoprenylcysteine O-methyltransferase Ste14
MSELLLPRALFAFLALPGVVAFLVPWMLHPRVPASAAGIPVFVLGVAGLLWCVRDFYVTGKGTLAPWALLFPGWMLWIYLTILAVGFHLRVVINEEPFLARTHGQDWADYRSNVRRWV